MSNIQNKPKIIVILGPTSSGKTGMGINLARKFNGEIVSADSRQVYRGMDIGTGKDLVDYETGGAKVPYHLIDVADPQDQYDLASYKRDAEQSIADIIARGKLPVVVGGSGLYLEALVDNYQLSTVKTDNALRDNLEAKDIDEIFSIIKTKNPIFAEKINNSDRHNKRRLIRYAEVFSSSQHQAIKNESLYNSLIIGLELDKEELQNRIKQRIINRLEQQDMVEEVNDLNRQGISWQRLESFGLEYKFISWYLQEKIDYEQMIDRLHKATNQFAKRQMTWFRRWQKNGKTIHWLNYQQTAEAGELVEEFLK